MGLWTLGDFIIHKLLYILIILMCTNFTLALIIFFIDGSLVPKVTSSEYHSISISDHAPLTLNIRLSSQPYYSSPWRFSTLLLSDDAFNAFIESSTDEFITMNKNKSVSYSLLWESLKANLCGQIISYSAHCNKTHKARVDELLSKFWTLTDKVLLIHHRV